MYLLSDNLIYLELLFSDNKVKMFCRLITLSSSVLSSPFIVNQSLSYLIFKARLSKLFE